jgi:hypothetical protein
VLCFDNQQEQVQELTRIIKAENSFSNHHIVLPAFDVYFAAPNNKAIIS